MLACAGIYLVDIVNDVSLYYNDPPQDNAVSYTDISATTESKYLHSVIMRPVDLTSLMIRKNELQISAASAPNSVKYMDKFKVSGIVFDHPEILSYNGMTGDTFRLVADHPDEMEPIVIGLSTSAGVRDYAEFIINMYPNSPASGSYTDLRLMYTGNAFFHANKCIIAPEFDIIKRDLNISIIPARIDEPYETEVMKNTSDGLIVGYLTDSNQFPAIDAGISFDEEIALEKYVNGEWVLNQQVTIHKSSVVLGVRDNNNDYHWIRVEEVHGTYYNITLNSRPGQELDLPPGSYICGIRYVSNPLYNEAIRNFKLTIKPIPTVLEFRKGDSDTWNDMTDGFSDELTYSDSTNYEFRLSDGIKNRPLVDYPLWLQIGLVPKSDNLNLEDGNYADSFGDYIRKGYETDALVQRYYRQDLYGKPITYPFYNENEGQIQTFGPQFYQMVPTDNNGIASFGVDGQIFKDIMDDYTTVLLNDPLSIESIYLYARVFYTSEFSQHSMQMQEKVYFDDVYDINLLGNDEWIYTVDDGDLSIDSVFYQPRGRDYLYSNPYQDKVASEGVINFRKDDTMLISTYQEVSGDTDFMLGAQVIEADIVNDQYVPEEHDESNFLERDGLRQGDRFTAKLEIYDYSDSVTVVDEYLKNPITGEYVPYEQEADDSGVVNYTCSAEKLGKYFKNLMPGRYNVHYTAVPSAANTHSYYYNVPAEARSELSIKSSSMYKMDEPSHLYSLSNFIANDYSTTINITNDETKYDAVIDENYPVLTAHVSILNTSDLGEDYCNTDLITFQVLINDGLYYEKHVNNTLDNNEFDLEIPLRFLEGTRPDIKFMTRFTPDPEQAIDWATEYDNYSGNNWELYSEDLVTNAYNLYEISANYSVEVERMELHQTSIRNDEQVWDLSKELSLHDGTDDNKWEYLNGSTEETILAEQAEPIISFDADHPDFKDSLIEVTTENNKLMFSINRSAIQWDPQYQNLTLYDNLYGYVELEKPFEVQIQRWNITNVVDSSSEYVYEVIDGRQFVEDHYDQSPATVDWGHSVRLSRYLGNVLDDSSVDERDAIYFGLNPHESVSIQSENVYLPYQLRLEWELHAPIPNGFDFETDNLKIRIGFDIEQYNAQDPIRANYEWILDSSTLTDPDSPVTFLDNTLIIDDTIMSIDIPSNLQSKFTVLTLNVSVLEYSGNAVPLQFFILGGNIVGSENIMQISAAYPKELRARLFSSNMIYYWTENASILGAQTEPGDVPFNDVYYSLEESGDSRTDSLTDVMSMWDWNVYRTDDIYAKPEKWNYEEETGRYTELYELCGEYKNKYTAYESNNGDEVNFTMATLKFHEDSMDNVEEPMIYSGILKLYDKRPTDFDDPTDGVILNERRITLIVNPSTWKQYNHRITIKSTPVSQNNYSTSLDGYDLKLPDVEDSVKEFSLSYFMNASDSDILVTDWADMVKKDDAEDINDFKNYMWYDEDNYATMFDLLDGDEYWTDHAKLSGGDIALVLTENEGLCRFSINISELYNMSRGFSIGEYDYLQIPFLIDNSTMIDNVTVKTATSGGERTLQYYNTTVLNQTYVKNDYYNISGLSVEDIIFEINFSRGSDSPGAETLDIIPMFATWGLALIKEGSVGKASVEVTDVGQNVGTNQTITNIYPSVFESAITPTTMSYELNFPSEFENPQLSRISCKTPENHSLSLSLYSAGLLERNLINNSVTDVYYSYKFDQPTNEFQNKMMDFFASYIPMPAWNSDIGIAENDFIKWGYQESLDLDNDGEYDLIVQYYDGEGKGFDVCDTLKDGTEINYFENGIQDSILYDFGADGTWNYQEKWDKVIDTYNITDLKEYQVGESEYRYCNYIMRTEKIVYEYYQDLTGDGIFNLATTEYKTRNLKSPLPSYREYFVNKDHELKNYFETNITESDWTAWVDAVERKIDLDADGVYERTEVREDRFRNNNTILANNDFELIYETYHIYMMQGDEVVEEHGNELEEEATFVLLGPDYIQDWLDTSIDNNNISGRFVFERDVPVVIDPRTEIPQSIRVDEHGTVAWYDSNNDGYYEIGFIFTNASMEDSVAVAVYLSRSGEQRVFIDEKEYRRSGDAILAGHWLSDLYSYADIMDITWDAAWEAGMDELDSDDFWKIFAIDTIATAVIMFSMALLPFVGPLAFLLTAGAFLAWQYVFRPMTMDAAERAGWIHGEKGYELGKPEKELHTFTDYALVGGFNLLNDIKAFGWGYPIPFYTERAYFNDVNAFWQDLHPEEFDTGDKDAELHERASLYVKFDIPQFWSERAGTKLGQLDFIKAIEESGFLKHPTDDRLKGLDIEFGVPNYDHPPYYAEALEEFAETEVPDNEDPGEVFNRTFFDRAARHRRILHQYFYRAPPFGTQNLWKDVNETKSWNVEDRLNAAQLRFRQHSAASFTNFTFMTGDEGQPLYTAGHEPDMNYSDPLVYEIDYVMMCMFSAYRTGYVRGESYHPTLFGIHLGLNILQSIVGILAGGLGSAIKGSRAADISFGESMRNTWNTMGGTGGIAGIAGEVFEEVVKEELVSSSAEILGVSAPLAEQLGEILGGYGVLNHLSGEGGLIGDALSFARKIRVIYQGLFPSSSVRETVDKYNSELEDASTDADGKSDVSRARENMERLGLGAKSRIAVDRSFSTIIMENVRGSGIRAMLGGLKNLVTAVRTLSKVADITARDYDNVNGRIKDFEKTMHAVIAQTVLRGSNDVMDAVLNLRLWHEGRLGHDADTGMFRSQHVEFTMRDGTVLRFEPDGTVTMNGGQVSDVRDIPPGTGIRNLQNLLAQSVKCEMVDPMDSDTIKAMEKVYGESKSMFAAPLYEFKVWLLENNWNMILTGEKGDLVALFKHLFPPKIENIPDDITENQKLHADYKKAFKDGFRFFDLNSWTGKFGGLSGGRSAFLGEMFEIYIKHILQKDNLLKFNGAGKNLATSLLNCMDLNEDLNQQEKDYITKLIKNYESGGDFKITVEKVGQQGGKSDVNLLVTFSYQNEEKKSTVGISAKFYSDLTSLNLGRKVATNFVDDCNIHDPEGNFDIDAFLDNPQGKAEDFKDSIRTNAENILRHFLQGDAENPASNPAHLLLIGHNKVVAHGDPKFYVANNNALLDTIFRNAKVTVDPNWKDGKPGSFKILVNKKLIATLSYDADSETFRMETRAAFKDIIEDHAAALLADFSPVK